MGDESQLSEVVSLNLLADVPAILHVVFDPDFAVSLCDEEEGITIVALLDDGVLGKEEQSPYVVDQEVNQILTVLEDVISQNCTLEDMLGGLASETGADHA